MSEEKLDEIQGVLDDIRAILLMINQDKIDDAKKKLLKAGSMEHTIYNLCKDGITNEDIASQLKKDEKYVRAVISNLKQKGLIKTIVRDEKKVHQQRF